MEMTLELLTVQEAAAALRVSRDTIYDRIRAGKLRAFKLDEAPNASLRIERAELDRFLRNRVTKRS
jgi:excisionase family DNA binding protein